MKVLMFGWEFPPHISGGLGTACYGLTKGLSHHGVDVALVVPKSFGDEDQRNVRILNASDVEIDIRNSEMFHYSNEISYIEINSHLVPYIGLDDYFNVVNQLESGVFAQESTSKEKRHYIFSGGYGQNLMEEVNKYALVAAEIAQTEEFDIIHAH
ncbi:MAG TPA: glycogen/starch synthase, partial [Bacteroidales bacterium]|nr:glycogen/starch synthase [Bacteroidales bacterium]